MKGKERKKLFKIRTQHQKLIWFPLMSEFRSDWFQILSVEFTVTAAPSTGPRGTEWASYLDPG